MSAFTESVVEDAALAWLESLGYAVLHGPEIGWATVLRGSCVENSWQVAASPPSTGPGALS